PPQRGAQRTLVRSPQRRAAATRSLGGGGGQRRRQRGGCGMRKDIEVLADDTMLTLLGDRHVNAPYGLFGGLPGATAATLLVRDGATTPLGSKAVCTLRAGDVVSFRLSGAGGYGDPAERDPARVREDVRQGLVTPGAAARLYGTNPPGDRG
ncbi:MAG: hydantoinase B/oxoprolinase family protein, partial [Alphaproteobacteria bacterium]